MVVRNVLDLPEAEVSRLLNQVLRRFSPRHRSISRTLTRSFEQIRPVLDMLGLHADGIPEERRLLIGSYFTMEYSIESAAFYNPSMVEDPDQQGLAEGQMRVVVSVRATGEGHVSSIAFRRAVLLPDGGVELEDPGRHVDVPEIVTRHVYEKAVFLRKLEEMNVRKDIIAEVMGRLAERFIYGELQASLEQSRKRPNLSYTRQKVLQAINWLATSHYEVTFSRDTAISERVLFPVSFTESNGIEDARFVRFVDDDGTVTYYGTYTAYNGFAILPKLLMTRDFYHFQVAPLNGEYAQNKGMSLFPRKIRGQYAMVSRCDGVNLYVMYSDSVGLWRDAVRILSPTRPWELVQIGNAGSPLETEYGWLLVTHGVGPLRTYCLGACLLDLDDPTRVIGSLREPLLMPAESEREGYVPNVVYSCGALIHNGRLVVPYGMSDWATGFATVPMDRLLQELRKPT
jgi:predicted GH43/DUF377 family glycosyl hydrolase